MVHRPDASSDHEEKRQNTSQANQSVHPYRLNLLMAEVLFLNGSKRLLRSQLFAPQNLSSQIPDQVRPAWRQFDTGWAHSLRPLGTRG